ncbi:MAG TPA: enoyl-CoA hydratase-related protein, partial [Myxococcaceae bacterium]|nr:enoyl-CoA hydratase-related protein [Myxococcaceae bacterium]
MNAPKSFELEVKERVARITLSRPDKLNALTFEVYRELTDVFAQLEREPGVSAVVVTGKGRG